MKLIDKATLVTEIESRIKSMEECFNGKFPMSQSVKETEQDKGKLVTYKLILSFLDTLEVKEIDLNEEIEKCLKRHSMLAVGKKDFTDIAKYFFELGMAVSNKAQKGE